MRSQVDSKYFSTDHNKLMFRTNGPTKNKEWSGGNGSEVVDIYKKAVNDNGYKLNDNNQLIEE